jgi:hypothetical protein
MNVREFVRTRPRLNRLRKDVRFAQQIPPRDLVKPRARAAWRVRRYTLLSYDRLASLHELARRAPEGAFVECGVCAGGSAGMAALGQPGREMWLLDSWEGLPEPGPEDIAIQGHRRAAGWNRAEQARVEELLVEKLCVPSSRLHLVRGWFEDTVPKTRAEIGSIALLHLDGDWYESIKLCLDQLYDQVTANGFVAVDDYHHWRGCKKAVDEFLAAREPVDLETVGGAVHWRKPAHA